MIKRRKQLYCKHIWNKIATKPITGTITSRYGESSSLRKSTHTGLDISAKTGSPIKSSGSWKSCMC